MKLTIKDIINNAIDDIQRAKETIEDLQSECRDHLGINGTLTDTEVLIDDMNNSIERLATIEYTIISAIMAGVYAGNIESAEKGFINEFGADSITHCYEYLEIAENFELPYDEDGSICTDVVHDVISRIVWDKYANVNSEIKYFEVELTNYDENNVPTGGYTICIKAKREPSLIEAKEFLAEDLRTFGYEGVLDVCEITYEEACEFYDMENESEFPIFE